MKKLNHNRTWKITYKTEDKIGTFLVRGFKQQEECLIWAKQNLRYQLNLKSIEIIDAKTI